MVQEGDLVTWFDETMRCPRIGRVKLLRRVDAIVTASDFDRIVPIGEMRLLKDGPREKVGQTTMEVGH